MKKVYAMLALALSFGISATAAPVLKAKQAQAVNTETMVSTPLVFDGSSVKHKVRANGPAKAVTSTQDLVGLKKWNGTLMFGQKKHTNGTIMNGEQTGVCTIEDPKADRITIMDFPSYNMQVKADVDMAKKEVYIDNGVFVGTAQTQTGTVDVYIYVEKHSGISYDEETGLWGYDKDPEAAEQAVGKILDDGSISFDGYTLIASNPDMIKKGSVFLMLNTANIVFEAAPSNTPVESEYTSRGFGEYVDPFLIPAFNGSQKAPVNKKAEIFTKKVDGAIMVAVKNPYKDVPGTVVDKNGNNVEVDNFWKSVGFQEGTGEGWLVFQVFQGEKFKEYPGVTACLQMVACGAESDDSEAQDGSVITEYYPYNLEGAIMYESGENDLLLRLQSWEDAGLAYTSLENNVITIRNTWFGITGAPTGGYWWQNSAGESLPHPEGTVTLPDGWDNFSGIESVAGENVNAPVKYYNLQGIELAAPVKGQLTIKKQGNKTVKFIAK